MTSTDTTPTAEPSSLDERLQEFVGTSSGPGSIARDPVNESMIRHWCDAMGDTNPVYTDPEAAAASDHGGIVAPPTMLQAWTMVGLAPRPDADPEDVPVSGPNQVLDEAGFTSVVATNCEQEYFRYLRPGDRLHLNTIVESISGEKTTGLGTGHFVTTLQSYTTDDGELVGTMKFRILKFRPAPKAEPPTDEAATRRPRPARNRDNQHYWEGVEQGELLIQRCTSCGHLRHPPRPACPECQGLDWDTVLVAGEGVVYSYVVHHHPPVPGLDPPYVVVLVELPEGVRIVGNIIGADPDDVEVGMAVSVEFVAVDDELTLPMWRPTGDER